MAKQPKAVGIYNNEIFIANFNEDGTIMGFDVLRPVSTSQLEYFRDESEIKERVRDLWIEAVRTGRYEDSLDDYAQGVIDETDMDDEENYPFKDESGLEYLTEDEREKADAFLLETEDIEVGTWEASGSYSPTIEVHHNDGWYSDFKKFDLVFDLQLATQYYKSLKKK